MKLREALQQQAPSLALQRAAADEIARLDRALQLAEQNAASQDRLIRNLQQHATELEDPAFNALVRPA